MKADEKQKIPGDLVFAGFHHVPLRKYPAWRYHKVMDPLIVHDTEEDRGAKVKGYDEAFTPITANQTLINWFWDLEDFSEKQLVVFARDEWGVDLPIEAGQERLLQAIFELGKWAPQNRGRIALMAHTIQLNYDETIETIRKMVEGGGGEVETMEVVA